MSQMPGFQATSRTLATSTPLDVALVGANGEQIVQNLSVRTNDGATYLYVGKAATGSSTASAVWQVQRITKADTTVVWADGDASFDNVWNDYATLSYS